MLEDELIGKLFIYEFGKIAVIISRSKKIKNHNEIYNTFIVNAGYY